MGRKRYSPVQAFTKRTKEEKTAGIFRTSSPVPVFRLHRNRYHLQAGNLRPVRLITGAGLRIITPFNNLIEEGCNQAVQTMDINRF